VKGKKNIIIFCFAEEKKTCIGKHEVEKYYGKHVCLFICAPVTIEQKRSYVDIYCQS
jgi:hypothetical protein